MWGWNRTRDKARDVNSTEVYVTDDEKGGGESVQNVLAIFIT
jgi:hypothetical protein